MWLNESTYASAAELYTDDRIPVADRQILAVTLRTFDKVRELHGASLLINSGRRSPERQVELRDQGKKAATTSPHVYGAALDVDVPDGKTDEYLVAMIYGAARLLKYPVPRIGWVTYRGSAASSTFVHFDYAFLLPAGLIHTLPLAAQQAWVEGMRW